MTEQHAAESKVYHVIGAGPATPPQYARVTATLSDDEIEDELKTDRGRTDPGWRNALLHEREQRSATR